MSEIIEATLWRTMKILRVFDKNSLYRAVNMTHDCHIKRITRYINHLNREGLIHHTPNGWVLSHQAPAVAPIYRQIRKTHP